MCKKGRALNGRLYKLFNGAGSCNIVCAECPVGERLAKLYPRMQENKQRVRTPLVEGSLLKELPEVWKKEQRDKYQKLAEVFFKKEEISNAA